MFEFEYSGGVFKPSNHVSDKFLLFLMAGTEELPFYQCRQDSLVFRKEVDNDQAFATELPYGKIFVMRSGFGVQKMYHSFYFRFLDDPLGMITIKPLERSSPHYFKGAIKLLRKKEVLGLLPKDSQSRQFAEKQQPLPLELLKQMIKLDRAATRKEVRHVRIGKPKK